MAIKISSKLISALLLLTFPVFAQLKIGGGASAAGGTLVCTTPPTTGCTFSPSSYTGPGPVTVTVTCAGTEQATYTLDGSTPNIASTLYSGPITISSVGTTVLNAIGSNLIAHNANTQTSLGDIPGTGIGYKCNTQNTQAYGSLACTAAGGVTGQPSNVTLTAGSTMAYTQTSAGSAQSLIPYFGTATAGSVDTCTYFAQDKYIEAVGSNISNNEVDGQVQNSTYNVQHTIGWQANQSGTNSGKWQIDANGGTGWVTTDCTTAIPISTSAYTHIAITAHWVNGDTSLCGGSQAAGCLYYDHQTVNGTDCDLSYLGGQPQNATSYRSLLINQDQLDSTSAGGTIGRNIQQNTVACSAGPPSPVTTGIYTITSGGAAATWTDTLANTYTCTTNSSGVCTVKLTQYRDNNDSGANQFENRNPYSLSIPLSGCTTYTQSGVTISATGSRNITLSGC